MAIKDPNGLEGKTIYNAMGSNYLSLGADNSVSYSVLKWIDPSDSDAPENALYYNEQRSTLNKKSIVYYDKAGRIIRDVITKESETRLGKEKLYVDYFYNSKGQIKSKTLPYYIGAQDTLWVSFEYDRFGRTTQVVNADLSVVSYSYNDFQRLVTITTSKNGVNTTIIQKFNGLGELIETTNNDGSKVAFSYYANGQLKESGVVGKNENVTMQYDIFGNKTSVTDPSSGTSLFEYNAFGELKSSTDARSYSTTYEYDILGRVVQKTVQNGVTTNYQYDSGIIGTLSSISSSNNINVNYSYDNYGRQVGYTENINGKQLTTNFEYDDLCRLIKYTYPTGYALEYVYFENSSQVDEIIQSDNSEVIWQAGNSNEYFNFENYDIGNLGTVEMQCDELGRFKRKFFATYFDYSINYDNRGNVDERKDDI